MATISKEVELAQKMIIHALFNSAEAQSLTISEVKYHLRFFFSERIFNEAISLILSVLARDLAKKVARAEGRVKSLELEARVAELVRAGNSAIVELRKNESEYSYGRYLRAVKKWDALIAKMEEGKGTDTNELDELGLGMC